MIIKYNDAADTLVAHGKVRWAEYRIKITRLLIIGYSTSIAVLYGMLSNGVPEREAYPNGNFELGVTVALCIALFVYMTYLLILVFRRKAGFFSQINTISARWRSHGANQMSVVLDETGIKYQTPEYTLEAKWPLILGYSQYKNYIFIKVSLNWYSDVVINTDLLTGEEKENLLSMLQKAGVRR